MRNYQKTMFMTKHLLTVFYTLIIESNNCSPQYKCEKHFNSLSQIVPQFNVTIIWIFGIAGHRKSKVDHVGGLAKVTIRRETATEKKSTMLFK